MELSEVWAAPGIKEIVKRERKKMNYKKIILEVLLWVVFITCLVLDVGQYQPEFKRYFSCVELACPISFVVFFSHRVLLVKNRDQGETTR